MTPVDDVSEYRPDDVPTPPVTRGGSHVRESRGLAFVGDFVDSEELQTTALAALESADVAVLKAAVIKLYTAAATGLMYKQDIAEKRHAETERKRRQRRNRHGMSRDVTGQDGTGRDTPSPSPFPPSPSFPPHPPNNPYPLTPSPTPASPLAAEFADDDHRLAYERIRMGAKTPMAVDATLRAVQSGMTGGGGFDWPVIGQALVELEGAGGKFSAEAVRGFCRRLVSPPPVNRGGLSQRDANLAALHSFANRETNA